MTITEKIEMYKGKKAFIKNVSKAFEATPRISSVTSIDYEVYKKEIDKDITYFAEYIIVSFFGGGKSVRQVNGNSCTANFREIGKLLDGGYYEENRQYETLEDNGFTFVSISGEDKLKELLSKPMEHIRDVRECFNYCKDGNDVEKVIRMIPNCFGSFEVEYGEDEETFTIINYYEENGVDECEEVEYEFYEED
jgi:hypothetical protein